MLLYSKLQSNKVTRLIIYPFTAPGMQKEIEFENFLATSQKKKQTNKKKNDTELLLLLYQMTG